MPNARRKNGESEEEARLRYNAEQRDYRALRKATGRPVHEGFYDIVKDRAQRYRKKYGITVEYAEALLASQGGCCAICGTPLVLDNRSVEQGSWSAIDHCHATGKVRGVLCMQCNQGLGKFKDNPVTLESAAAYLRKL